MASTVNAMQTPLSGELLVTCPACKARVRLEPVLQSVNLSFYTDLDGQILRTEASFAIAHVCDHIHHFVPQPTGEKSGGVPTFVLVCACGTHQGEE